MLLYDDWDGLFSKLVKAYKELSMVTYASSAIAYLEGLSGMLDKNEVVINGNLEEGKSTFWKVTSWLSYLLVRKYAICLEDIDLPIFLIP